MDNRQYKILEHLSNKGPGIISIRSVLLEIFPNVDSKERSEVKEAAKAVNRLLKGMVDNKYLVWEAHRPLGAASKNGYSWLNTVDIKASIQEEGINAFNYEFSRGPQERVNQSVSEISNSVSKVNAALVGSLHSQQRTQYISLLLAGLSAAFILFFASQALLDKTPQRLKEIRNQLRDQMKQAEELQVSLDEINHSIKKLKSDTVLVKQVST